MEDCGMPGIHCTPVEAWTASSYVAVIVIAACLVMAIKAWRRSKGSN